MDMISSEDSDVKATGSRVLSAADVRWNMAVVIMLDSIFWMGFNDFLIVIQPLLTHLGASNTLIGLVTSVRFMAVIGVTISPFISRRFRIKKWYMFVAHIPYLTMMALMGLAVIHSRNMGWSNPELLRVVLFMSVAQWTFAGFVDLPHQEYVAACIPMSHRGRYTGWSFTVGGVFALTSAAIAYWMLRHYPKPASFGYVLIMGWGIAQCGYLVSLLGRERPTPVEKSPKAWSRDMLGAFWADKSYVRFLLIYFLGGVLVSSAYPFVNIYGFKQLGMIAAASATFQIIGSVVRIPTSFLFGMITDKLGAKRTFPWWFIVGAVGFLPPIIMQNDIGVYISSGIFVLFTTAQLPGLLALLYGIPKPENRSGHYAVQLLTSWTAMAIGPLFIGFLCDQFPYKVVFATCGIISLIMFPVSKCVLSVLSDKPEAYS